MQAWNQWGSSASFQGAVFPGTDITPAAPIPPPAAPPSGYPMGGYPYYGPGGMPPNMSGYGAQQWGLAQQQYQQWEQWQQQYAEWQKQYGDKYQAQMMSMAGGLPGTVPVPPPTQTTDSKTGSIGSNRSDSAAAVSLPTVTGSQSITSYNTITSDGGTKRPHEIGKDEKADTEQANKKLKESQDDVSEAERVFDQQFRNWEEQYNKWKAQNVNHPDKDQYREYEAKWESWREQLLLKREQMKKKREAKICDTKGNTVDINSQEPSSTDHQKHGTNSILATGKQIQAPSSVPSTTQQSSFNPLNPIQAFNFPSFNTPPPLVQQSMGFPAFGSQTFPMSQQPPYGMQQGMFPNQSLFPGMGLMGANQPSGLGMLATSPLMMNINAPSNLSKTSNPDDLIKKENTLEQTSIGSGAIPDRNKSYEDKSDMSFTNKAEPIGKEGIPGLDLLDQSNIKNVATSDRVYDQKGVDPLSEVNERQSFNKPPPGFAGQNQGISRNQERSDFGPGGNFSFTNRPPPNFGPPPGQNNSGFGPNHQFGPTSQPPPNLMPPNRQDPFQDVSGFNSNMYNQKEKPFDKTSVSSQAFDANKKLPSLMDRFDTSQAFDANKKLPSLMDRFDTSQGFDSTRKLPGLMDGFDPSKGPPMFAKQSNENTVKDDRFEPWDNRGQTETEMFDNFQEENRNFDNSDFSNKYLPEKPIGMLTGRGGIDERSFPPVNETKFDRLHRPPRQDDFEHSNFSRDSDDFSRGEPKFSPGNFGGPGRKSGLEFDSPDIDRPGDRFQRNIGPQDKFSKQDNRLVGPRGNFPYSSERFNALGNKNFGGRESLDRGVKKPDFLPKANRGPPGDRFGNSEDGFIGKRGPDDLFPGKFDTDDRELPGDRNRMLGPPRGFGGSDNKYLPPNNFGGGFSNSRQPLGAVKPDEKNTPFLNNENESHKRPSDNMSDGHHPVKNDPTAKKASGPLIGGEGFVKERRTADEDAGQKKSDSPFLKSGKPDVADTTRFGPTGSGPWEDHNRFGPLSGPNVPFKGYSRDFDERRGPMPVPIAPPVLRRNVSDWSSVSPTVIDYRHKPAPFTSLSDLDIPESLEPMQTFDYAHGANPGPAIFKDNWRKPYETEEWHPERDGRGRGREGSDKFAPRGRWHEEEWKNDRYGERGGRGRGRNRGEWNPRGRDERDQWKDDRDLGKRNDKQDRFERNYRNDKNERDRPDIPKRDENRDRRDENRDRRDENRDRPDEKDQGDSRYRDAKSSRVRNDKKEKEEKPSNEKVEQETMKPLAEDKKPVQRLPAVLVEDILNAPGRFNRPHKIAIILRGPPGSGKTFVAKLIKDKEVEMGGSAPRILSLDDYFMMETETEETDPESGRKVIIKKGMVYEYEACMEEQYRKSLAKAFHKTIKDGYFPFIILDSVNNKLDHYEDLHQYAKHRGFQVYICEMDMDVNMCAKRNIHKRTEDEIKAVVDSWEPTPFSQNLLDVRSLLQSVSITEVDMEDTVAEEPEQEKEGSEEKQEENKGEGESGEDSTDIAEGLGALLKSKWDNMEHTGEKLDRLDGLAKARKSSDTIKDWLQLPEDYYEPSQSVSGKKRVRWADLEERREQEKMRAIGFVVGQTDWSRMMDPSFGEDKLTQTKYI